MKKKPIQVVKACPRCKEQLLHPRNDRPYCEECGYPEEDYDIERLAEAVHKAYCQYQKDIKGKEYWTKGDYSKLTDEVKEVDRYTVRAVLKELEEK